MKKINDNVVHIRGVVPLDGEAPKQRRNIKSRIIKILVACAAVGTFATVGILLYMQTLTYTDTVVVRSYTDVSVVNSQCVEFQSGILRFGKDGVSYLDDEGQAIWNHSYEISNPSIEKTEVSAAIADIGGNLIVVMDEDGVKGEIETVLPIEKISVSEQGVVAALVQDGSTPMVICYDAVGNVLVEHTTSLSGTGYPIGIALSEDGTGLLVTYLQVSEEGMFSNYSYYYFGDESLVSGSQVASGQCEGVVIAEARFIDEETSVMISTEGITIFKGIESPELAYEIEVSDEIQSVFYGDGLIGLLLKKSSGDGNEVRVYDSNGEILVAEDYSGEYTNVDIINNQIIMYEGYNCLIYTMQGVLRYTGDMGAELSVVIPMFGINKYIVLGDNGMEEIRLVR